jgi:hypothetical protein
VGGNDRRRKVENFVGLGIVGHGSSPASGFVLWTYKKATLGKQQENMSRRSENAVAIALTTKSYVGFVVYR